MLSIYWFFCWRFLISFCIKRFFGMNIYTATQLSNNVIIILFIIKNNLKSKQIVAGRVNKPLLLVIRVLYLVDRSVYLVVRSVYLVDKSVNWMDWSLHLVDKSVYLPDCSVYLVNRSLHFVDRSLYLADRSEFLVTTSSTLLSNAWFWDWSNAGSFNKILFSAIACTINISRKIEATIAATK